MEFFGRVISGTIELASIPFTIFGFTFSCWQVFLFMVLAGVVVWFIRNAFGG